MGRIIAGRITVHDHAEEICNAIKALGISRKKISVFFVNPDGQHHLLRMGGDKRVSPGTSESGKGAWFGTGVGAAAGATIGSVAGPPGAVVGAGVGAYTGSLAGAVNKTDKTDESADSGETSPAGVDRKAGLHIATEVGEGNRQEVVELLQRYQGEQIEEANGHIEDGEWVDFDPTEPVRPVY